LPDKDRYALLTVDTEALPRRASTEHVRRLIWGEHAQGRAGIRELCGIGDEFRAKHVFFVDLCGTYAKPDEMRAVIRWLGQAGQDVQLHTHPEVLPKSFWQRHGLPAAPRYMNQFRDDARAEFVIRHFSDAMSGMTGKPVLAHRAGSFRWNANTLRALRAADIPLSFNSSMRARREGRCTHAEAANRPFTWSNGLVELPVTERWVPARGKRPERWVSLMYPPSPYFRYPGGWSFHSWPPFTPRLPFAVILLHSWSLLARDENGHAVYRDDALLEGYRRLLARVTKDYDVITSPDLLDLLARGKIQASHIVNIEQAEYKG